MLTYNCNSRLLILKTVTLYKHNILKARNTQLTRHGFNFQWRSCSSETSSLSEQVKQLATERSSLLIGPLFGVGSMCCANLLHPGDLTVEHTHDVGPPARARTLLVRVPVASLPLSFFYVLETCQAVGWPSVKETLSTCIKHLLSQEEIINQTDNKICTKMAVTMRLNCGFFSLAHCIHSLCIETSLLLTIRALAHTPAFCRSRIRSWSFSHVPALPLPVVSLILNAAHERYLYIEIGGGAGVA
jgi:hypothetical protein